MLNDSTDGILEDVNVKVDLVANCLEPAKHAREGRCGSRIPVAIL
jgi:hypothetical protein